MVLPAALTLLLAAILPGPGLAPADVVLLLQIGVAESEIIAYADGRGGFEPFDPASWAALERLGAGDRLRARLSRAEPGFDGLSELAKTSDVFQDRESGVSFVHPSGWTVARTARGRGGVSYRIAPRSAGAPRAFAGPCVFLFVQQESGLPPEAVAPALDGLKRAVVRRLRDAGLEAATQPGGAAPFLGGPRDTFRIMAPAGGGGTGVLEMALAVDGLGRAAGAGFTAPEGDRAATREAFERVAKSLVLR